MMGESTLPPPAHGTKKSGIPGAAMNLAGAFGQHLQALLALAGHESKEAAGHFVRLLILGVVALIGAIFGYILLLFFVAFLLAQLLGVSWVWICLGLAVLHFVVAAVCVLLVKEGVRRPVFATTSAELKRDFEALKSKPNP